MRITRKEAHAEAIRLLIVVAENMDLAHAYLKDALTAVSVETGSGPYRITARQAVAVIDELLKSAREAVCDNCGALIADCACAWSNHPVGSKEVP